MKIANFSVNRPVAIFMVILIILLLGTVSLSKLNTDLYPELNFPVALTIVEYSGVGPEEMEKVVSRPLEEQLSTLTNVKSIRSQSTLGSSIVIVEFNWGTDMEQATIKMREKVDFIKPFLPEDISEPMILKMDLNMMPVLMIGISGEQDLADIKKIVEDKIKPRFERIEGVASVIILGGETREIQVIADPQKLQAYGLTIQDITNTIRGENNNYSVGDVEQGKKDYLVRVKGEFTSLQELENILVPLKTGTTLKLKDLAEVKDAYAEMKSYSMLDGVPSISVGIQKQSDANTVKVSESVLQEAEKLEKELPGNISIKVAFDQGEFIRKAINTVKNNGYVGAILAIVILFLFLRSMRSTLIIGVAIPISIITTFILVYFAGLSLNMMSLGGLALGIGMMVDSAIVILENIYRHRQQGLGRIEAAKMGASEVGSAVIASTITTICVFLPIVFVEGIASQLFRPMALTVSFSLFASLLVALSLIPMLSSKLLIIEENGTNEKPRNFMQRLGQRWYNSLQKLDSLYNKLLRWVMRHKKTVIFATLGMLIVSILLIPFVGMEFIPASDSGYFQVEMELPNSTVLEETEKVAFEVAETINNIPEVESQFITVGGRGGFMSGTASNMSSIMGRLVPLKDRDRGVEEIIDELRQKTAHIPGAEITVKADDSGMGSSSAIDITLKGADLTTLENIANDIAGKVKSVAGTREVTTSLEEGSPELEVKIDRDKAGQYGISSYQVSQIVRSGLEGANASKYRVRGDEIDIKVYLPEINRQNIDDLKRLMVPSNFGFNVPVEEIAEISYKTGPTSIERVDQSRKVSVTGDIAGRDLKSVMTDIRTALADYPLPSGYEIEFGGSNKDMEESFRSLGLALIMAILLVYMVLAAQFEALLYPFIIMFSIPPTLIGVVGGLLITGRTFSVPTFIGVIMLAGIVVNNAIVLVDYINTLRKRGIPKEEAILQAGPIRLRPILMTTLTTVLALVPQVLGIGEGAEVSAPMATAVVGGLIFSTLITLVLIPVMYSILDTLGNKIHRFFSRVVLKEKTQEGI